MIINSIKIIYMRIILYIFFCISLSVSIYMHGVTNWRALGHLTSAQEGGCWFDLIFPKLNGNLAQYAAKWSPISNPQAFKSLPNKPHSSIHNSYSYIKTSESIKR